MALRKDLAGQGLDAGPDGELLRDLTLDPDRNYQPTGPPPGTRYKPCKPR